MFFCPPSETKHVVTQGFSGCRFVSLVNSHYCPLRCSFKFRKKIEVFKRLNEFTKQTHSLEIPILRTTGNCVAGVTEVKVESCM